MRIAQITPVYPPYHGGIGAVAFEYTERLRERGHQVEVLTPEYKAEENDPKHVHRIKPIFKFGNAALVPEIKARLDNYDLVHLHYPFFGGADFVSHWKAMSRVPLVTTYHMDVKGRGLKSLIFKTYGSFVRSGVLKASDKILVSSLDYIKHSQVKWFYRHHQERFMEMPFGVDAKRFSPGSGESLRSRLNIPEDASVIIFVGGLDKAHYFKGVSVLLKALPPTTYHLIIVGQGELKNKYESQARDLGIADQVHFVGGVESEELPEYYRAADIHVLPATDRSEAFGIVTLEAAASGLPSVVSNLFGVRSVIEPEKTGLLVRPGSVSSLQRKLKRLIEEKSMRQEMGQAARQRVEEKYDREKIIDQLEKVYENLHY
jgi:glycosyltransferase involved in cell wall biosynthesis